ncbi:hypothetical protein niasHT_027657 [Heterodera trifolii]|uniref:Uncharacterized protein n=1 Tax=Heterodera trifolii TaxID=157864 RepID=A0ABD2K5H8_9BILA
MMMMFQNVFNKSANAICACFYAYVFYFDYRLSQKYPQLNPVLGAYITKFVWLTMINLLIQLLYHTTAAIVAICSIRPRSFMSKFHFIATAIVFPASFTVVMLFWGLYLMDPATVTRKEARFVFDFKWFNHALHTFPLFAMLLDFSIWHHHRPSKVSALKAILCFSLFYIIHIHFFYVCFNFWAYPILAQMSFRGRAWFIFFCTIFMFCAFAIGDAFNRVLPRKLTSVMEE